MSILSRIGDSIKGVYAITHPLKWLLITLLPPLFLITVVILLLAAVISAADTRSDDRHGEIEGSSDAETNAMHVASVMYAYGYTPEMTAALLGNIEEEAGSIDFTAMEVYSGSRDPAGINGGLSYGEAFQIGPQKQQVISDGMLGYTTNTRNQYAMYYRGGGLFGFSYGNAIRLYNFCQDYDWDGDGEPDGYVWWQIPKDEEIPTGGDLQMLYFIKTAQESLKRFEDFVNSYSFDTEEAIRQYTYAFDLAYELNVPIPAELGSHLEDYSGSLSGSTPWTSRDARVEHANKWYDFLKEKEVNEEYGRQILERAGIRTEGE